MPHTHARRRGATVLFRRKIPSDLRDRFGSHEIVRSIGRATPGEARRILYRLWSQTELVFMRVRSEQGLSREEIGRVVSKAVDEFHDDLELAIADVAPNTPLPMMDEPVNQADRLRGKAALLNVVLDRNDVADRTGAVRILARAVLGKDIEQGSIEERRLCRAITKALQAEMLPAAAEFDRLASSRPAHSVVQPICEFEYEATPEILAALRESKTGDDLTSLLDRLTPVTDIAPTTPHLASSPVTGPAQLRHADVLMSELWPKFTADKVLMREWKATEAHATGTTLKLWLQCIGDRRPSDYTSNDVSNFHRLLKCLPSNYYHESTYRKTYEREGVLAVIELSKTHRVDRMSDKTWNSHNSSVNAFFLWCADKGQAVLKGTESICKGEFIKIKKTPVRRADDPSRVVYEDEQIRTLFSAPKFMGAASGHYWGRKGVLVVRDHRYWMTLIGAYHGNRREESAVLKVKHVRRTAAGIAYFNWMAPDLPDLLKAEGSPRDVPIHRDLLKLGFMEARVDGRDPEAPLFPEAVSYGIMQRDAEPFGSWFGRFRKSCGVNDSRLDFHSWRHTVSTRLLRAGVPKSHVEEIVGHESEGRRSEMSAYNHGMSIELLKDGIDALVLPIDIDALNAAVKQSDAVDPSAAWPDLSDPAIVPKLRKTRG